MRIELVDPGGFLAQDIVVNLRKANLVAPQYLQAVMQRLLETAPHAIFIGGRSVLTTTERSGAKTEGGRFQAATAARPTIKRHHVCGVPTEPTNHKPGIAAPRG